MLAPLWLKFGTRIEGLKVTSISFGINLINIKRVIHVSNFTCRAKSDFCHGYKINCFEEQAENWYEARLNIRGVPFGS